MMKMKLNKKIAAASAMLMLSTTMLGTSTFAWFTMNKEVTVTGMQMKTTVGSNLLISTTADDTQFKKAITEGRKALLEPTSTVDGVDYYYTVNAGANGDALAEDYTKYAEDDGTGWSDIDASKTNYDAAFNTTYGLPSPVIGDFNTGYGYVDYTFYLKATNTKNTAVSLDMTNCNILYDSDGDGTPEAAPSDKAWRVAMFVQDLGTSVTTGTAPTKSAGGTYSGALKKTILRISGAQNQSGASSNLAVDSTTTLGAVTYDTAATVDSALATGATKYYYVVVRVWLEGEDTTCTSQTYATLTEAYSLDLGFALDGGESGSKAAVTNITTNTNP